MDMNYLIYFNLRLTNYQAIILFGTFHRLIRKENHVRIRPNPVVVFNFGLRSTQDHNHTGIQNHIVFQYFLDCKTVGFFLKISKEIGNAWRKSLMRENRASLTRP